MIESETHISTEGAERPITSVHEAYQELRRATQVVSFIEEGVGKEDRGYIDGLQRSLTRVENYLGSVALHVRFEQLMSEGQREDEPKNGDGRITLREGLEIDLMGARILRDGEEFSLTLGEHKVIALLAEDPGWVISREKIEETLYGEDHFDAGYPNTVPVFISSLRKKLGEEPRSPKFIVNRKGFGYMLEWREDVS